MRRLPHRRVVHVQIIADRAHHHRAGVQPDADLYIKPLAPAQLRGIAADGVLHAQGGIAGAHGMIFMGERRPKEGHDAVAQHLIDRPLVAVHGLHHPFEDGIEDGPRLLWVAVGQQLHGAFEIGEEHCDLLALAFERVAGGENLLGQVQGRVGVWGALGLFSGRWRRCCAPPPDQHRARLIHSDALGLNEFSLQVLEGVIIELELPFERAIGHAATALEHRHRVIENLLEGHGRPSTTLARVPRESNIRPGGSQ
jgi:hypothetical protein